MSATIERPAAARPWPRHRDRGARSGDLGDPGIDRAPPALALDPDHPPRQQRPAEPRKSKVGGHQASSASVVDHPHRALLRIPAPRRPRLDQTARLARLPRRAIPARPPRPLLPDDAARVRRPAGLSVAHQGPGSGRFFDRLGRAGRGGAGVRRAGRQIRRARASATSAPTASSRSSATPSWTRGMSGKRSPRRQSRGWATSSGSSTSTARVSTGSSPACARRG